jgi:hypothetical protein
MNKNYPFILHILGVGWPCTFERCVDAAVFLFGLFITNVLSVTFVGGLF